MGQKAVGCFFNFYFLHLLLFTKLVHKHSNLIETHVCQNTALHTHRHTSTYSCALKQCDYIAHNGHFYQLAASLFEAI